MKKVRWIWMLALAIAFSGCTRAIVASYNEDPDIDFREYATFGWDDPLNKAVAENHNPLINNDLVNKKIKEAISSQMRGRGFQYSERTPDLKINFHMMVESKSRVTSSPNNYYFWWRNDVQTINYEEGTLIIDIIDASTDQLVWQGYSTGSINKRNLMDGLAPTVSKIFTKFNYRIPLADPVPPRKESTP